MSTLAKSSSKPQAAKPQTGKAQPKPESIAPIPERRAEEAVGRDEEVRPLAHRKWQEAGCPVGDGVEFWLAAEAEILRRKKPR